MRRKAIIVSMLGIISGAANGQSSVILYGVVDEPIEYVNHLANGVPSVNPTTGAIIQKPGGNRISMPTGGGLSGSRWGLRGTESLGGGLSALFVLESGFGLDTGVSQQSARLFGRQAFVGLDSSAGRLTFGRQYTSLFDVMANFSPTLYASLYEPAVAQVGANVRSDNTVKYTGSFGPLGVVAHYSFGVGVSAIGLTPLAGGGAGEVPGNFRDNTGYGAGISYSNNALSFGVGYDQWNPAATTGAPGKAQKVIFAASYGSGPIKVMGGYRWGKTVDSAGRPLVRDDYYWVGANYSATKALGLTLAYYYDNPKTFKTIATGSDLDLSNPWQISFVADYSLSKRTDVYLTTAYSRHAGLNFDTSATSFSSGYFLAQGKTDQFGAAVGLRHRF